MMKGDHGPTKLLHALTWGAFKHASHAPQVRACNYYQELMSAALQRSYYTQSLCINNYHSLIQEV